MAHGDPQAYSDLHKDAYGFRPTRIPTWESRQAYIADMRALESIIWDDDESNVEASLEQY